MSIEILNPIPGTARRTSLSAAERYERQGRGRMEGGKFRFFAESERNCQTRQSALSRLLAPPPPDPITSIGMAHLDQVQGLPCAGPAVRVFTILSKRGPGYRPFAVA